MKLLRGVFLVVIGFSVGIAHSQSVGSGVTSPSSNGGGGTIPNTTNLITGGGSNTAADSGIAPANVDTLNGNQTITGTKAFPTATTLGGVAFNSLTGVGKWIAGVPSISGSSDVITLWSGGPGTSSNFLAGDGVLRTVTFPQTISVNGALSAPALAFNGTWITGGSSTTTKPFWLVEPTGTTSASWSTSGTGIGVNATSAFIGNLIDLQVNSSRIFSVNAASGTVTYSSWNELANRYALGAVYGGLTLNSTGSVFWTNSGVYTGTVDVGISRLTAGAMGVGPTQGSFSSTLQAGVTSTDPGCTTTLHIGKQWFDITTTTTIYKVCLNVAGTLTWVTK